jgi:hypothetical protein
MLTEETLFKAKIVHLILSSDTTKALELLSEHYKVETPKLKVGMPKRHSKNPGCYVSSSKRIHVSHRDILSNAHVILHEFYHHLRTVKNSQGGIEKYADGFAKDYLDAYKKVVSTRIV